MTTIVIPCHNHAVKVREAIDSALRQTAPVEIIVIDDGSTDGVSAVLAEYGKRVTAIQIPHSGPSVARNIGLDAASGEFVMLLDADDVIAPTKVADQIAEFQSDTGWVLCDVLIEDAAKGKQLASERYGYDKRELDGWIRPQLLEGNFIPIMSPLIRRSALGKIRFEDNRVPEDWHFWCELAGAARVRYLPKVLATYRKSLTGRSRIPTGARHVVRNIKPPLRLNLGCGVPGTVTWAPKPGMVNLDKSTGWRFEDGLGDFVTGSVSGITISHALMYVEEKYWPAVFAEFARVLTPGGVLRVTEDATDDPASSVYRTGWKGSESAVTLTSAAMMRGYMERAGLSAVDVGLNETRFTDDSLCQNRHRGAPHCFWMEGIKLSAVLFSPHNDDESLFAAFTILRYRPRVIVCFKSTGDYGDPEVREAETRDAMSVLGGSPVEQWDGGDLVAQMRDLDARVSPAKVFAPSSNTSHPDHIAVAKAAAEVFGERLTCYQTYDANGKVRDGKSVEFEPPWLHSKLRALARYKSQTTHPRANKFFLEDLREYMSE